jgi:hypothetical protein
MPYMLGVGKDIDVRAARNREPYHRIIRIANVFEEGWIEAF